MNSSRWWDTPNALLLLAALNTLTARLTATEWVPYLDQAQTLILLAAILGLALGYSRFRAGTVRLFILLLGSTAVIWQLGETLPSIPYWAWKVASLGERWPPILAALLRQENITDPLFFLTLAFITVWTAGSVAACLLVRTGNAWNALLIPGILLFGIHISDKFWPFRAWYLVLYAFLALLIIARTAYLHNLRRWKQRRTRLPAYMGVDLTRTTVFVALLILLLSGGIPAAREVLPSMQHTWEESTAPLRERFRPLFASLRATVGVVSDYYGETLTLGRGQPLSEAIVMTVQAPAEPPAGVRFYWRARVYDRYAENAWKSTLTEEAPISEGLFTVPGLASQPRWQTGLTFTLRRPFGTLHVVPQPLGVDHPGTAYFARNPDGTIDLGYLQADPILRTGASYTVRAALTRATIADLRAAGADYPLWVQQRYLQLPETITPRTRALARQLAQGQNTPYDITQAVTRYLREAIEYQTTIEAPPKEQEITDWLLFDYRKGFCNYYATAEVVLLRTLGIPARLAVGYAQGEYHRLQSEGPPAGEAEGERSPAESLLAAYTVRQRDLHAWPEVYFPGIGWVEFEPTASQAPILRLSGEASAAPSPTLRNQPAAEHPPALTPAPEPPQPPAPPPGKPSPWLAFALRAAAILLGALVLFALTPQGGYFLRYHLRHELAAIARRLGISPPPRWERLPADLPEPPPPLALLLEARLRRWGLPIPKALRQWAAWTRLRPQERAYRSLDRALRLLGTPARPAETPAERARRLERLLPAARPAIRSLAEACIRLWYAPPHTALPSTEAVRQAARQVYLAAWRAWLDNKLRRWQEPA